MDNKITNGGYDESLLNNWKDQIMTFVNNRINKDKSYLRNTYSYNFNEVKQELERLQSLYVLTPADKAGNNIIFTCKAFYIKSIKEELSASNTYQLTRSSRNSFNSTNTAIADFSNLYGLRVRDEMCRKGPLIPLNSSSSSRFSSLDEIQRRYEKSVVSSALFPLPGFSCLHIFPAFVNCNYYSSYWPIL